MQFTMKSLTSLGASEEDELICGFMKGIELPPVSEEMALILVQLQGYEKRYAVTSSDMFDSADCEKRELDPDLDAWATLYRAYQELAAEPAESACAMA